MDKQNSENIDDSSERTSVRDDQVTTAFAEASLEEAPEFLRVGTHTTSRPGNTGSNTKTPASKSVTSHPPRGANPAVFLLLFVTLGAVSYAFYFGYLEPVPVFGNPMGLVWLMAGLSGLFAFMAAWAWGRRARVDDEALLVHMASGEHGPPLMVTSQTGQVLYANSAFRVLFKTNVDTEIPQALRLITPDEDALTGVNRLLNAACGGAQDNEEFAFSTVNNGVQRWRLDVRPVGGRAGQGMVTWTARNVTAWRELDDVRRREESLLADLLDNLPVGFFSVNGAGHIVYANETLCTWLGIRLGDMCEQGLSFADFVVESGEHEEDENGHNGQVTLKGKDGDAFPAMLMQSGRVDDAGELLYTRSIVVRDLVKKPEIPESSAIAVSDQDALAVARRLYWLFDEAPVAIALLDLKANISDCNGAFLKMLGLHKDDVLQHPFADRLAKEDQGEVNAQLSKVVMGIMRAAHLDVKMTSVGDREVMASLYVSSMEDAYGEVIGLILHFIDTTEQKHLEVQFAQSQKMQSIGQLAGGIAHDFNNLLTAMIGFSDLLLTRHGPGDPSFSDIDQIRQNAVRATALVRQLLAFSRKQTLAPQPVNVKEKLSDLSEVLSRLLGVNIEFNIEHDRDVWIVRVDPVQFDQVILNLAVNARDAMPGGGTLTIRTRNLDISEPTQRGMELVPAGDYVIIDVIDTGEGIRKEDLNHIFEPFFTTKDIGDGTGLGLSTVYGIVHQTGGHILVDSAPGEGTAFTVCLPRYLEPESMSVDGVGLADGSVADQVRTDRSANVPDLAKENEITDLTGAGTILLVEDEDPVRMFGSRALRNKGYTVLEAANGEEALEVINATDAKIDLIVTDVMMPGMDGHTLVQFVCQEMPNIKVIFISGYAENVIPGGLSPQSGFEFLPKPFSLKDLAEKVKDVLNPRVRPH